MSGGMFGVIILHEAMMIRKHALHKRHKCTVKDVGVEWRIHFVFKYAYPAPSSKAYASPYMDFHWMFGPATG